jgi:diguanylate cyclase (GGDEF)-like protein
MRGDVSAVVRYRLRTVAVGVHSTFLAVVVLAVYPLLPGRPVVRVGPYSALVVAAAVGAVVVRSLPWARLLEHGQATAMLYAWSALDIGLVTIGVLLTGGPHSSLFWLYVLTTLFFAASYPPVGQIVLFASTSVLYLVVAATGSIRAAEVFIRLAVLGITAFMATFLSRELLAETERHAEAREESEHRANLLASVADAAKNMSTVDTDNVLRAVVGAAVNAGLEAAELCMFDEAAGTWYQAYHQGTTVDGYEKVQPAHVGLAGVVRSERRTIVVDDYSSWDPGMPAVRTAGSFRGMVASPVWSAGELAGVLIAGRAAPGILPSEVECLDLLAAQAGAALVVARRYAERRSFEQELRHQATHDPLTGLPNRTLLLDRVGHAMAASGRTHATLAVLFLDLDRFKTINDSLGHDAGDRLLQAVAERLHGCLRPGDTLARYGGDEFTILLEDTCERDAAVVAGRVLDALTRPFLLSGREVVITTSIGIALAGAGTDRLDPMRDADLAMYRAKAAGGGRWEVFAPVMDEEAKARLDAETDLRRAIAMKEFTLEYQPVVSLDTGRIASVEALVRWEHPERGRVSPAAFVPLAEETGLIVPLGRWVLEEACRQARVWQESGHDLRVAVNLSALQFGDPDLVEDLARLLRTHALEPRRLVIEVTVSVFVDNADEAVATMDAIRQLGVSLALDDFGQGYSSLSYLKRLPLQTVKIDRAFVDGLGASAADRAIVRAVVSLADELGMSVVAEGVETEAQLDHVRRLGCTSVQGYLFSPPVPPEVLERMLADVIPVTVVLA